MVISIDLRCFASSLLVPVIYSISRPIFSSLGTNQRFAHMEERLESIQELVSRPIHQEDRDEARRSKQPKA